MICQLFNKDLLPLEKELIEAVHKRDIGCRKCFTKEDLHVHHILPRSANGKDTMENLVLLCASCHRRQDLKFDRLRYLTIFEKRMIEENKHVQSMLERD
jgi:hypothetical protein